MQLDTPAKRLKWARDHHGKYKTATDAARAFGWPVSTYLGHENGDRNPSRDAAKRYAKAYHVRWEWLIENEGSPLRGDEDLPAALDRAAAGNHLRVLLRAYDLTPDRLGFSEAEWQEIERGAEVPPALVLSLHDLTRLPVSYIRHGLVDELAPDDAKKLLSATLQNRTAPAPLTSPASRRGRNRSGSPARSR